MQRMNGHEVSRDEARQRKAGPTAAKGNDTFAPAPTGMVSEFLDFEALRLTIILNYRLIAAIMGIGLLLGAASLVILPKIYTARASVQIDQQERKVLGTEDNDPVAFGTEADRFLQTQVDILTSRAMAKRVSDAMGLAANDHFLEQTMGKVPSDMTREERADRVIDTLQRNLSVDLPRNSRVVGVVYKSRDAQLSARVANTFVAEFIKGNIQRKFSASSYSLEFLSNQLGVAKIRLEQSERLLITYSRAAGLIDASARATTQGEAQGPQSLITANLVELNSRSAEAKAARLQAEERWLEASKTPLMELPEVLSNDAIQRLLQKRAELSSSLQELRVHLKADHPSVVQAATELAELDREARILAEAIRSSIKNQYKTAARQDAALQGAVNGLKLATLSEQDRGVRYNILKREVDTNRQLYDSLLQRYKEVSAASGVTVNNVTQVDIAEAPRRPTSPRTLVNMAIALALSLMAAAAAVLLRGHLADTINDPREVESRLAVPLLGVVPRDSTGNPI
jgi:succinoglycan biosynthesis transport protein ExoP